MDDNAIRLLVQLIQTGGFISVSCHREFSPPYVAIDLPGGLQITINYDLYEQIRADAGLPEGVCDDNDES